MSLLSTSLFRTFIRVWISEYPTTYRRVLLDDSETFFITTVLICFGYLFLSFGPRTTPPLNQEPDIGNQLRYQYDPAGLTTGPPSFTTLPIQSTPLRPLFIHNTPKSASDINVPNTPVDLPSSVLQPSLTREHIRQVDRNVIVRHYPNQQSLRESYEGGSWVLME